MTWEHGLMMFFIGCTITVIGFLIAFMVASRVVHKANKKNDQLINSEKSNSKDNLEITISCNEESIENYLKDGWKIKDKKSKEKVCSWKSIPANNTCNIEKDKGCKIIKPNSFGTETIYLLEK